MSIEVERSWWLQKVILEHCHDKPGAGHMGMNKTTERVKRYAIWYKMMDSCLVYVRSCSVCNRQKKPQRMSKAHHVRYHAGSPHRGAIRMAHREAR